MNLTRSNDQVLHLSHMESIGVREIRRDVSAYLRRVEAGESFRVTDRGRQVAVLVGTTEALRLGTAEIIAQLVASGVYRTIEEALTAGIEALVRQMRKELVDTAVVEGYTRIPQEPDPWVEEASRQALAAADAW